MINGINIGQPSLKVIFDKSKTDIFQTFNCVKVGSIVSFNAATRTAEVQISFRRTLSIPLPDGTRIVSYPLLVDCPVFTLRGNSTVVKPADPVAGDECIILFADSNIDAWYDNGGEAVPPDSRRHDLSDGIALVGLNSLAHPLVSALAADEAGVADATVKLAIKNGKMSMANGSTNFITAMNTFLTAVSTSAVLDTPTKTAATNLKTALGLLFY